MKFIAWKIESLSCSQWPKAINQMPLGIAHLVTPGFIPVLKATQKNLNAALQTVAFLILVALAELLAKDFRHGAYHIPIVRKVVILHQISCHRLWIFSKKWSTIVSTLLFSISNAITTLEKLHFLNKPAPHNEIYQQSDILRFLSPCSHITVSGMQ